MTISPARRPLRAAWSRAAGLVRLSVPARTAAPSRPGAREWAVVGLILAGALALRLWGIRAGLPGAGLFSPDEDTVVPKSLRLLREGTLNPDWFLYPSLYLVLLAAAMGVVGLVLGGPGELSFSSSAAYAWDPSPYILTGRAISVVAGVGLVLGTWALGRRAYGPAVGLVAAPLVAVAPVAVAYSHVAVTDMAMTALLTLSLWLLVGAVREGSRKRLLWAAVVLGAATSTKYNAGLAVLPLLAAAVLLAREDGARWARALRAALAPAGLVLATFLMGTPFALLDPVTFADDFIRQNRIVADGWLGFEGSGPGWLYNVHPVLWNAVGAGGLLLGAVGLAVAGVRRRRADLVLAPYVLVYFVYVSTWNAHFDRYLLPVVPALAVLGARAGVWAVRASLARRLPAAAIAAAAVMLAGFAVAAHESLALVRDYTRRDLRLDAARLVADHVPRGSFLVTDPLGPPLLDRSDGMTIAGGGLPAHWYELIRLETPRPGAHPDGRRDVAALRRAGIRWVVTSEDIRARVLAAPSVYPVESRFYRQLPRRARLVARVPASLGPGVALWDLHSPPAGRRVEPRRI